MEINIGKLLNQHFEITKNIKKDDLGYFLQARILPDGSIRTVRLIQVDSPLISAPQLHALQLEAQKKATFTHAYSIPFFPPQICDDGLILSQSYTEGETLQELVKNSGRPLPSEYADYIAAHILSATAALHDENLCHGSLDSAHILISSSGEVLISFLSLSSSDCAENQAYAPESLALNPYQQDLFSIGIILADLYFGILPYQTQSQAETCEILPYYRAALLNVSDLRPEIAEMIRRCLFTADSESFANAVELFYAFHETAERQEKLDTVPNRINQPKEDNFEVVLTTTINNKSSQTVFPAESVRKPFPLVQILIGALALLLCSVIIFRFFINPAEKTATPDFRGTLAVLNVTETAIGIHATQTVIAASLPTSTPTATPTNLPTPTITPTPHPIIRRIGSQILWKADLRTMVYVPEGNFTMGSDQQFLYTQTNLIPKHSVFIDAFWIDKQEVTYEDYQICVVSGKCSPSESKEFAPSDPITDIRWEDAAAYCAVMGKTLPTEAEWEKAARSDDARLYPWGNQSPYGSERANSIPADISPYGVQDLATSVTEWVADFYADNILVPSESRNPLGPISGTMRVVKGGNNQSVDKDGDYLTFFRGRANSNTPQSIGFRCAALDVSVNDFNAEMLSEIADTAQSLTNIQPEEGCIARVGFVADVTIPDGTKVSPGEKIVKTWIFKNIGTCTISHDYKIVWASETLSNEQKLFDFGVSITQNEEAEVSISFNAKGQGKTRIPFNIAAPDGTTFGLGDRGRGEFWIEYDLN